MAENLEIALFAEDDAGGIRLIGRLADPDLVQDARERLAALGRQKLAELQGPVRLVQHTEDAGDPEESGS